MRIFRLAAPALLALAVLPAVAQNEERYAIEKTQDGYVRMDRNSGDMSICRESSGQLVCRLAVDERTALEDEMERLKTELEQLKSRVEALEQAPRAPLASELPDEETFDQALTLMERFFRRFMGIVQDLERDLGNPEPQPEQRT
jgi:hypothetical protein